MARVFTLCSCMHDMDAHQSTKPGFVPLVGQDFCYGDDGFCSCTGWEATARVLRYKRILEHRSLVEAIEFFRKKGWWYEWL